MNEISLNKKLTLGKLFLVGFMATGKTTIGKRLTRGSKYNISHPKNGQSILEVGMDQSNNPLNNKFLMSKGFSIDIVSYYDKLLRLEFSNNHLGETGFFIHFSNPF